MRPAHIFRFCLIVIAAITTLSFLYPQQGIKLFSLSLEFMSMKDLFSKEEEKVADISKIIADTLKEESSGEIITSDTLIRNDSLHIQHNPTSLQLFARFYENMKNAQKNDQLVRVVHYGDSQIEADRISGTLRENLQKKFGGSGVGIVPVTEVSDSRSNVFLDASENWKREEIVDKNKTVRNYGIIGSIYDMPGTDCWISIKTNKRAVALQQQLSHIKLLGSGTFNCSAKVDSLEPVTFQGSSDGFSVSDIELQNSNPTEIKLQFSGAKDAKLYGIALDGDNGVTVDNVSLRGSSGTEFTKMDSAFLKQQIKELNAGMVVLQFGVNVVPYIIKDYSYYQKLFYSQLAFFRENAPNAAILVIGVSDMARKQKGEFVSYPNIELIRDAMKQAAFDAGCAYWDLYEVMGGKNSMPEWVKAKPTLANKDYTHFNNRGAEIIGLKLYNALIEDMQRITKSKINS